MKSFLLYPRSRSRSAGGPPSRGFVEGTDSPSPPQTSVPLPSGHPVEPPALDPHTPSPSYFSPQDPPHRAFLHQNHVQIHISKINNFMSPSSVDNSELSDFEGMLWSQI